MVDGLEKQMGSRGRIVRVNARDKDSELAKILDFKFTPSFVFLDASGKELWRTIGRAPDKSKIISFLRQVDKEDEGDHS